MTQEACAERLGKDRSVIANGLRLLRLPDDVKTALASGALAMGHARALLERCHAFILGRPLPAPRNQQLRQRQESPEAGDVSEAQRRRSRRRRRWSATAGRSPRPPKRW